MNEPITHAQLAQQAAYLANDATRWAGDLMGPLPRWADPVRPETVARFVAAIRDRLDIIERWSDPAEAAPSTTANTRGDDDA